MGPGAPATEQGASQTTEKSISEGKQALQALLREKDLSRVVHEGVEPIRIEIESLGPQPWLWNEKGEYDGGGPGNGFARNVPTRKFIRIENADGTMVVAAAEQKFDNPFILPAAYEYEIGLGDAGPHFEIRDIAIWDGHNKVTVDMLGEGKGGKAAPTSYTAVSEGGKTTFSFADGTTKIYDGEFTTSIDSIAKTLRDAAKGGKPVMSKTVYTSSSPTTMPIAA